jgi:hypothetical protein
MFMLKRPPRRRVVMTRPRVSIPSRALAQVDPKAGMWQAHVPVSGREVSPPPLEPPPM